MASKSDVVIKLALVFFISLLSFAIGTFVGKKYSDNQHKIAQLEPQAKKADHTIATLVGPEGEKETTVSDDEIAQLAKEFADDETSEKKEVQDVAHAETKSDVHTASHAVAKAEDKKELKTDSKIVATEAPKENRTPSSLPQDIAKYSVGKYTIQIASYATEDEAIKKSSSLKEKGYGAFYVPAEVKGKTRYRVNVGLFATEKEAVSYRTEFSAKSNISDAIIQKIIR
jgi:DedD protein